LIGGSVQEGSNVFSNASRWTLSLKGATKDATPFGATGSWAVNIATIKSWSGRITCYLDTADTAQTTLFGLLNSTVTVTLTVQSTPHAFTGSAIITGIDPNVDSTGVETVDFSFTGTAACTYS